VSALLEYTAMHNSLPEDLINATIAQPLQWTPRILPAVGISIETLTEQNAALQCCINAVDAFLIVVVSSFLAWLDVQVQLHFILHVFS